MLGYYSHLVSAVVAAKASPEARAGAVTRVTAGATDRARGGALARARGVRAEEVTSTAAADVAGLAVVAVGLAGDLVVEVEGDGHNVANSVAGATTAGVEGVAGRGSSHGRGGDARRRSGSRSAEQVASAATTRLHVGVLSDGGVGLGDGILGGHVDGGR